MKPAIISIFLFIALTFNAFSQHSKVETWYDSKKLVIKERYFVLKKSPNIVDSLYTSYFQNGNINSIGIYVKNQAEGIWKYYYENGNLKMEGELKDNMPFGKWKYYYENGNINMEGMLDKSGREGEWVFYFENGNKKSKGQYKKDKKDGHWQYYFEDGEAKAQAIFENDKGKYVEWYPNGKKKSEGLIVDGKSNGVWKYYYEDGSLKAEGIEKNGVKEGKWKYFHQNGQVASEGEYISGLEEGNWRHYHDNGNLSAEGVEKEGKKNGYWKLYYKDGNFKGEGNFVDGSGQYKEYYEGSGKLKVEGYVKNEKNDGKWNYYYEDGKLEGTCFFNNGVGKYTGYYQNGKLKMEGTIEDGYKVGIWKLYKEDGELAGYYKTYYENDVPVFTKVEEEKSNTPGDSAITHIPKGFIPKKKSRYFTKKVNEFHGIMVGGQPLRILARLPELSLSAEYYFQERLGYEINFSYIRSPLFRSHSSLGLDERSSKGYSVYLRQKFYQKDRDQGMLYFGHEVRFTSLFHSVRLGDNSIPRQYLQTVSKDATMFEYTFVVGDRLMKDAQKPGFSVDIFMGLGLGYRYVSNSWEDGENYNKFFKLKRGLNSGITVPIRFGVTVGYVFKKN